MSGRRELIESVLFNIGDAETPGINISGCDSVSQINVFPGGSISINISNKNSGINLHEVECYLDEKQREKIYRMCHGIAKQFSIYPQMRKYMKDKWNYSSMRDLTDASLVCLLRFMRDMEALNK